MYPPLLFRQSRSLNRRLQAALDPRVHLELRAALRRPRALFKSNTLLRSCCGLLTDGSESMTLTASSCSKFRRTGLVEIRSTSLSYSMGQFMSMALSLLNAAPCFGLLSRSTHIFSVGQYCTSISPISILSVMKKCLAFRCFVRLVLDSMPFVCNLMVDWSS